MTIWHPTARMSTDGEVANALVCKTSIRGFDPHSVLHKINSLRPFVYLLQPIITHDKVDCPQHDLIRMGWRWVDE